MSIHEAVCHQLARLAPGTRVRILFSNVGYALALRERDSYGNFNQMPSTTYMGQPFGIVPGQLHDVMVEVLPDRVVEVSFTMDELNSAVGGMVLAGRKLSRAQLADLIDAWVDAHPNQSPMTDMLVDWVQTHGRFE